MAVRNAKTIAVGDVIRSPLFEFGRIERPYGVILVGAKVAYLGNPEDDKARGYTFKDSSDGTRCDALFVVEATESRGGSNKSMETYFSFGTYVSARRLGADHYYDPEGVLIGFLMSGPFDELIPEVEVAGRIVTKMEPLPVTEPAQG